MKANLCLRALLLGVIFTTGLTGCHLYHMPVQQGNIINQESANNVRIGMSAQQVVAKLGTPVLQDPFKDNRILYIYTLKPSYKPFRSRTLILTLRNDHVINKMYRTDPKDQQIPKP